VNSADAAAPRLQRYEQRAFARIRKWGGYRQSGDYGTDPSVTELAAGSGLYAPGLFDHFHQFHHAPSLYLALQVTRSNGCRHRYRLGGGYIASARRAWIVAPALSAGWHDALRREGAGEVQTPVKLPPGIDIPIGAPLFFRHAKAGELAERFTNFLLLQGGKIVGRHLPIEATAMFHLSNAQP